MNPAPVTLADVQAIQALAKCEATPDQQKRALDWITFSACGLKADPFEPGSPDVSAYLMGRQSVAKQIAAVLNTDPASIRRANKETRP